MALVACPECRREVSTAAPACPHCGNPMTPAYAAPAQPQPPGSEQTLWRGSPSWVLSVGKLLRFLIVGIGLPLLIWWGLPKLPLPPIRVPLVSLICWLIAGVIILIRLVEFLIAYARVRTTSYIVTNQRVMIESGLATKSLADIDLRYIDDTTFRQSFFERLFGVGDVSIVSTDKVAPRYVLRAVPDPRAVRELVRAQAYQASQRQLFTRAT